MKRDIILLGLVMTLFTLAVFLWPVKHNIRAHPVTNKVPLDNLSCTNTISMTLYCYDICTQYHNGALSNGIIEFNFNTNEITCYCNK